MNGEARDLPLWRSLLFVPANVERFVARAHTRGADAIILDLEDSVTLAEKDAARAALPNAAARVASHGVDVLARINRPWRLAIRDLEAVVDEHVHTIVVPKVEDAGHIRLVAEVMEELEAERGLPRGRIGLLAFVESPGALAQVDGIAAASDRLVGLFLGADDFSVETGMQPDKAGLLGPSQQIVFAARRAGILPLGFVGSIADYSDLDAYRATIREARALGFAGGLAIHPSQVPIMNEEFMPSQEEVAHARGVVEAYEAACAAGRGATEYQGKMIDAPVVARARETLRLHQTFSK
ncbi:MAG TPA: CoA ester lyase [Arenicellales bacterium]|nr:CoA ester lyase [Arenicellales bacterium]